MNNGNTWIWNITDINNNLVSYTNPDASLDQFRFDIKTFDGNWKTAFYKKLNHSLNQPIPKGIDQPTLQDHRAIQ